MKHDNRFIRTVNESGFAASNEVWVDRETGVNYFYHAAGYSGGLCVLVDKDGKPVITDSYTLEHERY
ncbi:hypothetical protein SDC9_56809 [bioreactor metagenome]|uniref:DUF6440 domain-containing protein n=1 Tax=bioreactor metagenome TaxID=1076179 RepID=A0A644X3D9_9ZZZZ